jgi:hypothetical protein
MSTVDREIFCKKVARDYGVCEPHSYRFIVANSQSIGGSRGSGYRVPEDSTRDDGDDELNMQRRQRLNGRPSTVALAELRKRSARAAASRDCVFVLSARYYFPDARWLKKLRAAAAQTAKRCTLGEVLIADVVNAGQRHIALHVAWHSLLYSWHARAQQLVVLSRPTLSGWWMLGEAASSSSGGMVRESPRCGKTLRGRAGTSEHCSAVVSAGQDTVPWWSACRLVAIIAGWFAITHFRDFRPDTASNAARAKGPRRQARTPAAKAGEAGTTRAAGTPPLSLRRRATDSMARAEQGGGVVQLSSLQTGGARTRSMFVAVACRVSTADRLHDSDRPQRREGRRLVFSEHCLRQRGETRYHSSTRLVGDDLDGVARSAVVVKVAVSRGCWLGRWHRRRAENQGSEAARRQRRVRKACENKVQ